MRTSVAAAALILSLGAAAAPGSAGAAEAISPEELRQRLAQALSASQATVSLERQLKEISGSGAGFSFPDESGGGAVILGNQEFTRYFNGDSYFDGHRYWNCGDVRRGFRQVFSLEPRLTQTMGRLENLLARPGLWDSPALRAQASALVDQVSETSGRIEQAFPAEWLSAPSWMMADMAYTFRWELPDSARPKLPADAQVTRERFWLTGLDSPSYSWKAGQGALRGDFWFSNQMEALDPLHPSDGFWPRMIPLSVMAQPAAICLPDPKILLHGIWRIEYTGPGHGEPKVAETALVLQGRVLKQNGD